MFEIVGLPAYAVIDNGLHSEVHEVRIGTLGKGAGGWISKPGILVESIESYFWTSPAVPPYFRYDP